MIELTEQQALMVEKHEATPPRVVNPRNATPAAKLAAWLGISLACLLLSSPLTGQEPKLRRTFLGHTEGVTCVSISPDGKTLASGSYDETLRFWDLASGKETATLNLKVESDPRKRIFNEVYSLAFSPDGKTLAAGSSDNKLKLWDVGTHKATTLLNDFSARARRGTPLVAFSPDGKALALGGMCVQGIRLCDLAAGKQTATLEGFDAYGVLAITFTPDSKGLVAAGFHDGIKLWDLATSKKTAAWKTVEDEDTFTQVATFTSDSRTLATSQYHIDDCGKIKRWVTIWDAATGKKKGILKAYSVEVRVMAFSPDGKTLAFGGKDGTIKLWDVAQDNELATLRGHTAGISSLTYSRDGKMLASGSDDKTIKLWDVANVK